jgi:hypothetical protein
MPRGASAQALAKNCLEWLQFGSVPQPEHPRVPGSPVVRLWIGGRDPPSCQRFELCCGWSLSPAPMHIAARFHACISHSLNRRLATIRLVDTFDLPVPPLQIRQSTCSGAPRTMQCFSGKRGRALMNRYASALQSMERGEAPIIYRAILFWTNKLKPSAAPGEHNAIIRSKSESIVASFLWETIGLPLLP